VSAFAALHTQTVTVRPWVSEAASGWKGQASFGAPVPYRCRVEMKQRRVVGADGRERLSVGRVIIAGLVSIGVLDELALPAGYTPQRPPIIAVEKNPDPFGIASNTVVLF
jgi:hypothetical protein